MIGAIFLVFFCVKSALRRKVQRNVKILLLTIYGYLSIVMLKIGKWRLNDNFVLV